MHLPPDDRTHAVSVELIKDELSESILKTHRSHKLTGRYLSRCLKRIYDLVPVLEMTGKFWTASFRGTKPDWSHIHDRLSSKESVASPHERQQASSSSHWMFSEETLDGEEADVEPIGARMYRHIAKGGKRDA